MYIFKLDEDLIEKEIDRYITIHNESPDYLIFNENTFELLRKQTFPCNMYFDTNKITKYMGINIAFSNALKFGEMDIK
jgi:hypothetical protein